jgi:hypothetical protein
MSSTTPTDQTSQREDSKPQHSQKKKGFQQYDDKIENYGYCLRCLEWQFVPESTKCPDCRAENRFITDQQALKYAPEQ